MHGNSRQSFLHILILVVAAIIIFYPIFYTEYAYTDELTGLWQWRSGMQDSSGTLLQYGRYVTAKLASILFGSVATIKGLTWIRILALTGWLINIPIWYFILKKISEREKLPEILPFFSVLYMICTPSTIISIGWGACFELFLANTLGLLSGYFLYRGIRFQDNRISLSGWNFIASLVAGVTCLFTYQNCFGCFLIPFLLLFISSSTVSRKLIIGIAGYFLVYVIYYVLFKYSLKANHIDESIRTGLHINVGNKLPFFLARPLNSAFHFTTLFNENSITGAVVYILTAAFWFVASFIQRKSLKPVSRFNYFLFLFCLLGLIYLPSLIVKENYASNRTIFALSMAVFFIVADTLLRAKIIRQKSSFIVGIVCCLFVINAWYNFNLQFLTPVSKEYDAVRKFVEANYHNGIDSIHFIQPAEDFFEKKYGITRSWDEFGVPSTFFPWTPEVLVREIVYEKTGDATITQKLIVKSWAGKDIYVSDTTFRTTSTQLVIDTEQLLK
ncbi:MAG: hypothetical protein QM764_12300 [Chitinophagaceae bacterium]